MISRRAKTAERRPEKTQIQHQARKNPQAPQGKQDAGGVQSGQFARQSGDDPETDVVYQYVSVGKDDGPRGGNEFLKAGVPDDVVRVLVDPASPSGEDHHDDEGRQYAQGLPREKGGKALVPACRPGLERRTAPLL